MIVKFFCDNGANIHSCRSATFDTVINLGLDEGEWEDMSDEDKFNHAKDWAMEHVEIYWEDQA